MDRLERLCKKALKKWGIALQYVKLCEETGELLQAASKVFLNKWPKARLAEEIADVEIMLEQWKQAYSLHSDVEKLKLIKIKRIEEKLKHG